jgi:hypothetical protein
MKFIFMLFGLALLNIEMQAQKIINYKKDGNKQETLNEYVDISITNTPSNKVPAAPTSFAGVVTGPIYNIVASIIKNSLEKRQKSYTASYSNGSEFSHEVFNEQGLKSIVVKRYAINTLDDVDDSHLMAEYVLTLEPGANSLSIQLKSILLNRSKARYKSNDNLSIAINIKATPAEQIEKKDSTNKDAKPENKSTDSEGTITVPIIKVTGTNQDLSNKSNIINKIKLNGIDLSTSSSVKFSVSITETNINHIEPSKIQTIISNNSGDIQTILKAIFGVSDK